MNGELFSGLWLGMCAVLHDIVLQRRGVSADTAMRLARHFNTTAEFWIALQSDYDLRVAEVESSERIAREVRPGDVA